MFFVGAQAFVCQLSVARRETKRDVHPCPAGEPSEDFLRPARHRHARADGKGMMTRVACIAPHRAVNVTRTPWTTPLTLSLFLSSISSGCEKKALHRGQRSAHRSFPFSLPHPVSFSTGRAASTTQRCERSSFPWTFHTHDVSRWWFVDVLFVCSSREGLV